MSGHGGGLGDAPIDPGLREMMNGLAKGLDDILNGKDREPGTRRNGFILMVWPFGTDEGRCNYISNAERSDVVRLLREQLARFEGRAYDESGTAQ